MSTSIRQKITLFTLVPAVLFYSLVTAVFLYFSFRAASSEISRRHLQQSLHYAAVIDGNLREVAAAGKSLAVNLEYQDEAKNYYLEQAVSSLFAYSSLIVGVGLMNAEASTESVYWEKTLAGMQKGAPEDRIPDEEVARVITSDFSQLSWYTSPDPRDYNLFRTSLLLPVRRASGIHILRVDIDGAKLIEPLQWQDMRTRLLLLDGKGVMVYSSGISFPKLRVVEKFVKVGPCEAYSKVNVTTESDADMTGFLFSPVRSSGSDEPCGVFHEVMHRVIGLGQSINYRIESRGIKRWVTATPIASTGWYFSISILEKHILGPVINQAALSASLIALALVLMLMCLWAVSGRITRPLNLLKQRMNEYATSFGAALADDARDEATSLSRSFSSLLGRLRDREKALNLARANNIGHLVQQLRGSYFYFNLTPDGVITHVSPSLTAVLGYPAGQFRGEMQKFLTSSDINSEFDSKLQELISGHWEEAFEVEMHHHHDGVRRVELFCTVSSESTGGTAIEGMGNDITHRINDTEKFKLLIAASPDAIVVTNQDGIILMVNCRVQELFRYSEGELLNMPLAMLFDMRARERQPLLKPYEFHNPEYHCLDGFLSAGMDREGRHFPMEVSSNVLNTSEGIQISIVLRDITERKKIEAELVRAKVHAEHASRAKSMFLSNISHELRTPLNGVLGYAQLLLSDKKVPERYLESLKSLEECGLHLMTLINDILDMTKIESSGVVIDPQPFDLQTTLRTVLSSVRETARSKQLALTLNVENDVAAEVIGDNVKLRQVLINLVGNAVKFTQEGSVDVSVTTGGEKKLCFAVVDSGIGISEQEQTNLFKPFSQLKAGQKQGGTGLGLAISYRLVKAMGGELALESSIGKGSRFSFSIPYRVPEDGCGVEQGPLPPEETEAFTRLNGRRRILVVDDSTNNRDILVSALSSHGFSVDSAEDGLMAVERCRSHHYDLVLMDLKMPGMDGFTASRTIHGLPGLKSLKIIAVSASVSGRTRDEIGKCGISDFIAKPVRFRELFSKVYLGLSDQKDAGNDEIAQVGEKDPDIHSESALTMARVMAELLDIGDIQALKKQAALWRKDRAFGRYPERLVKLCSDLDMQAIETMKEELFRIAAKI